MENDTIHSTFFLDISKIQNGDFKVDRQNFQDEFFQSSQ